MCKNQRGIFLLEPRNSVDAIKCFRYILEKFNQRKCKLDYA